MGGRRKERERKEGKEKTKLRPISTVRSAVSMAKTQKRQGVRGKKDNVPSLAPRIWSIKSEMGTLRPWTGSYKPWTGLQK